MAKRKARKSARLRKGRVAKRPARPVLVGRSAKGRTAVAKQARPRTATRARKGRVAKRPARPALAGRSAKGRTAVAKRRKQARKAPAPQARLRKASAGQARKAPALDRERRTIADEGLVPTPPSSLDLDRSASAARSGRRELHEKFSQHTETSPAMTGGDIDADWESAYSVGDEAPGGDNPTPDQDIVDDIGRAVGVEYEDNEELKGDKKISDRDRKRWELDPASSEDYDER